MANTPNNASAANYYVQASPALQAAGFTPTFGKSKAGRTHFVDGDESDADSTFAADDTEPSERA